MAYQLSCLLGSNLLRSIPNFLLSKIIALSVVVNMIVVLLSPMIFPRGEQSLIGTLETKLKTGYSGSVLVAAWLVGSVWLCYCVIGIIRGGLNR
jgi:hypothetical protein